MAQTSPLEDAAAKAYWGDWDADETKMTLFIISIYDFVRAVMAPVPSVSQAHAKPYVNPQMFRAFLLMLGNDDLMYSDEDEKFLDLPTVFDMHRRYYALYKIQYDECSDPDTGDKVPLITRKGMEKWFGLRICLYIDDTFKAMNKMLADKGYPLLDPLSGEPWTYLAIPRSCLPARGDTHVKDPDAVRAALETHWPKVKGEILAAARQRGPVRREGGSTLDIMNQAADNVVAMQLQAANNTARMAAASALSYGAFQTSVALANGFTAQNAGNL